MIFDQATDMDGTDRGGGEVEALGHIDPMGVVEDGLDGSNVGGGGPADLHWHCSQLVAVDNRGMAQRPDWMLIDGSSIIFRAFYGVKSAAPAPDGRQINAVRGFTDTLTRLLYSRRPVHMAIGADADWRPQRRVDLIPSYKTHRTDEPVPPALIPQMAIIEGLLLCVGVDFVGVPGLEAEDVIASWVEQIPGRVEIVSGDRDLFALVRDLDVVVLYPEKGGMAEIDEAEVSRRYDIPGRSYGDFATLRGDPSDGLPGLPGIGPRSAAAMIRKYGTVEALMASGTLSASAYGYLERAIEVTRPGSAEPVALPAHGGMTYPVDPEGTAVLAAVLGMQDGVERLVRALNALAVEG
jgi:5'-3' exonuclease